MMALTQKYKKFVLHDENYDVPGERMPGEKVRIIEGNLIVDYNTFRKSKAEKAQLKAAKAQAKYDEMKR
jgi:hypothetical protein